MVPIDITPKATTSICPRFPCFFDDRIRTASSPPHPPASNLSCLPRMKRIILFGACQTTPCRPSATYLPRIAASRNVEETPQSAQHQYFWSVSFLALLFLMASSRMSTIIGRLATRPSNRIRTPSSHPTPSASRAPASGTGNSQLTFDVGGRDKVGPVHRSSAQSV